VRSTTLPIDVERYRGAAHTPLSMKGFFESTEKLPWYGHFIPIQSAVALFASVSGSLLSDQLI